ncbi:hypothetical protein CHLRE_03g177450v5 [Chlamydomonas reinhardtii]|uniref:BFN domain-containing protein n=1 Tax=Chlamydomonas reinhardtii TaxID=3055 RepID=A0A2K3DXJ2_CHLRE|nr:uncharacterized protein CHLRE_03g177450v5 [Chlamydomonas reinhardtii]PNW85238.1 hypothetical protein CHLRE_03g177450v5 [Chlamydomonas reinhardtii]
MQGRCSLRVQQRCRHGRIAGLRSVVLTCRLLSAARSVTSAATPPAAGAGAPVAATQDASCPLLAMPWSRRTALLGFSVLSGVALNLGGSGTAAAAPLLRSMGWTVESELTVLNDLEHPIKIYWLNYDGDAELFGSLNPGSVFTVKTYESHAWRFVDSSTGYTVAEHVAAAGQQVVRVASKTGGVVAYTTAQSPGLAAPQQRTLAGRGSGGAGLAQQEQLAAPSATEPPRPLEPSSPAPPPAAFEGFDGLGNDEAAYSLAQLREVSIYPGGGNVLLLLPGSDTPLEVALAGPEALSLVAATGSLEQRRPSTLGTWTRSLMASGVEVRRVCITRMVDGIFYSRIVLSRPNEPGGGSEAGASSLCSLDATPGDSLSLALALRRPIYVNNEVVRLHRSVMDVFIRRREAMEAAAASGVFDEAAEAEADRAAQDALDSITRAIPSAPRAVHDLQLDHTLSA